MKKLITVIAAVLCLSSLFSAGAEGIDIGTMFPPIAVPVLPSEDVPAEDVPAEDVPAEDTPAEDVPAEDVPAEDIDAIADGAMYWFVGGKMQSAMVTGFELSASTSGSLTLKWDKNSAADGYLVRHYYGGWKDHDIKGNANCQYTITGLSAYTRYSVTIQAYKIVNGKKSYGRIVKDTFCTTPTVVSGLKLKGRASDALRLSWDKNSTADGYIIEQKSGSKWVRIAKITNSSTTEYRIAKLKAGTAYDFRIRTYKMKGSTALYGAYKTISARTNPSTVTGLRLKGRASDALRLSWDKNSTADGYIIEQKIGSKWVRIAKLTKNSATEYRIAKLKAGTAYSFRIRTYKMSGKTALYSGYNTFSARTDPTAISGLTLKARAADALRLSWDKNTSADGYILEQKVGTKWVRIAKLTKNSTTECRIAKLKSGTTYSFRIRAYKMSGSTALYSGYKTISAKTK